MSNAFSKSSFNAFPLSVARLSSYKVADGFSLMSSTSRESIQLKIKEYFSNEKKMEREKRKEPGLMHYSIRFISILFIESFSDFLWFDIVTYVRLLLYSLWNQFYYSILDGACSNRKMVFFLSAWILSCSFLDCCCSWFLDREWILIDFFWANIKITLGK